MEDLKVKKIHIEENALLNKAVTITLLDVPNDRYVELTYKDKNGLLTKETRKKTEVFSDLEQLINENDVKKAEKSVSYQSKDEKKKPFLAYRFESGKKSKKTAVRIVGSKNGMLEEDREFLDSRTQYVRQIHIQSVGDFFKKGAVPIIAATIAAGIFIVGFDISSANEEYENWKRVRADRNKVIEQGGSMNYFGENETEALYQKWKEYQKDNVYTDNEKAAFEKFWSGQDLTMLNEMKAFFEVMYELKDDYDAAKDDLGMSKGK
jgi:hypothetical protein